MTQPRYSVCHMVGVGPRPPRCQPFPCSRSESAAVSDSGRNRSLLSCWWFSTRASVERHRGQEKRAVSFQIQTFPLSSGRVIWVARLLKIFYDVLNPECGSTLSCTVQPLEPFSWNQVHSFCIGHSFVTLKVHLNFKRATRLSGNDKEDLRVSM